MKFTMKNYSNFLLAIKMDDQWQNKSLNKVYIRDKEVSINSHWIKYFKAIWIMFFRNLPHTKESQPCSWQTLRSVFSIHFVLPLFPFHWGRLVSGRCLPRQGHCPHQPLPWQGHRLLGWWLGPVINKNILHFEVTGLFEVSLRVYIYFF